MPLLQKLSTPQVTAIALVSLLIFGGMIAVDSIAVTKYPDFVKHSNLDILVRIVSYEREYSYATIDKQKLNDVVAKLRPLSYVKNISVFHKIYTTAEMDNTSFIINSIVGANPSVFSHLNISITRGVFSNNSVAVREDIFQALNLSLGDYINVSCPPSSGHAFLLLPIKSTFEINNSLLEPEIKLLVTAPTLEYLVPRTHPWAVYTMVAADIDESIIDPVNPEIAQSMFSGLGNSLWSLSSDYTSVQVQFYLLGKLQQYIEWKSTFRYNVFLGLLPLTTVFWFVQYYLTELFFAKRKREIAVMIARGMDPSIKTGLFLKHLGEASIFGILIGAIIGIPISRIFIISPSGFLVYHINTDRLQEVPYVFSWYSLLIALEYILVVLIIGVLIYIVVKIYGMVIESISKKKKGLLKKLFLIFGGSYIDFVLLGYSILIFMFVFLNISLFSQINLTYNPIFLALLYFAPFAFIIGATRVIFRVIDYVVKPLAYTIKNYKLLYPIYIGIKNLTRKGFSAQTIGMVFALVIALSQTSGVIAQTYAPSISAREHWVYGTDFIVQFQMDYPNVTLAKELENLICENMSGTETHTMVMISGVFLHDMMYIRFVGVDPQTFVQTIYTDTGTTFVNTPYASTISELQKISNGIVISKTVSESLDLEEDDVLKIFSWETGIFASMRVIGIIDFAFSGVFLGDYLYYYFPEHPEFPGAYYSYQPSFQYMQKSNYVLTNYGIIETLNNSVIVTIGIKTNHNVSATEFYNSLHERIKSLRYKYIILQKVYIDSASVQIEQTLNDPMIQTLLSLLNINFVASLIVVLIVLWDFGLLLKRKRSREIAVFLALGESRTNVSFTVLFELLFILAYGAVIGLVASFPLSLVTGKTIGVYPLFILSYFFAENFLWLTISNIFYAIFLTILLGYIVLYLVLRMDLPKLLKIEWSPEKLVEEMEVTRG